MKLLVKAEPSVSLPVANIRDMICDSKKHMKYDDPKAQQTKIFSVIFNKLAIAWKRKNNIRPEDRSNMDASAPRISLG